MQYWLIFPNAMKSTLSIAIGYSDSWMESYFTLNAWHRWYWTIYLSFMCGLPGTIYHFWHLLAYFILPDKFFSIWLIIVNHSFEGNISFLFDQWIGLFSFVNVIFLKINLAIPQDIFIWYLLFVWCNSLVQQKSRNISNRLHTRLHYIYILFCFQQLKAVWIHLSSAVSQSLIASGLIFIYLFILNNSLKSF